MSYPSVDCTLDFKKSCSKDDAVAKLLGWLRGPICYETAEIAEEGVSIEQLKHMETLVFSLADHLKSLREEALYKASDAVESNSPDDVQQELLNAVLDIEDLIKFARNYLLDIEEELDKGEFSSLTIDQIATNNVGEICVTLKSLNQWAKTKYGIEILEENHIPPFDNAIHKKRERGLQRKQEQAILKAINQLGEDPKQLPKNPQGKPGVKAEVRSLLNKNPLFLGSKVFDKAWERLRDFRDIEDSN